MNASRKNEMLPKNLRSHRWKSALCTMMTLSVVAMSCGEVAAEPRKVTSNSQVLLDATVFDDDTGEDVQLIGLIHVQTKVSTSVSTLAVHANIREASFLAFVANDQAPNNPLLQELESLKEQIRELKVQIVALQQQLLELMNELEEVSNTDINPFLPGIQIDTQRAAELQRRIQQVSAALKRLQVELSEILDQMRDLLDEIQQMQESEEEPDELVSIYKAFGAVSVGPSICDHLACERIIEFDLISAAGATLPFQARLDLQFTPAGALLFADAVLEGETDSDGDDDGT